MRHVNLNNLKNLIIIVLLLTPFNSAFGSEKWDIGIYLEPWIAVVDGNIKSNNLSATDIDSGVLSSLLGVEIQKGNAGFYLEISGSKWKEDILLSTYNRMEFKYSITELGGIYRFNENIDFLLGVRHQAFGVKYVQPAGLSFENSTGILDVFAGARFTKNFGKKDKWNFGVATDVGTGDSDLVWSMKANLGYEFSQNWSVSGSLRRIDTDFQGGGINYDGTLNTYGLRIKYDF